MLANYLSYRHIYSKLYSMLSIRKGCFSSLKIDFADYVDPQDDL
jgi:hypothetical protein